MKIRTTGIYVPGWTLLPMVLGPEMIEASPLSSPLVLVAVESTLDILRHTAPK